MLHEKWTNNATTKWFSIFCVFHVLDIRLSFDFHDTRLRKKFRISGINYVIETLINFWGNA